jgi:hypothetical protein
MRSGSLPSRPRRTLSRNNRKPRTPVWNRRDAGSIKPYAEPETEVFKGFAGGPSVFQRERSTWRLPRSSRR